MIRVFSIIFCVSLATVLTSQEVWTLEKCVARALDQNLEVLGAELSQQNAKIDLKTSQHARYPSLNAGTGYSMNFGRGLDPVSNSYIARNIVSNSVQMNTNVLLFNFGRLNKAIEQSRIDLSAARADSDQTRRSIAILVAQQYIQAVFAEENLNVIEYQIDNFEEQLDQVQKLVNAGSRPQADVLEIEAQLATQRQNAIAAQSTLDMAMLNLKQTLRLPMDEHIELDIPEDVVSTLDPQAISLEEVWMVAAEREPALAAAEFRKQSAEYGVDIARTNYYPSLQLGANLSTNYSNQSQRITGYDNEVVEQVVIINGSETTVGFQQSVPRVEDNPYFDQLEENLFYGFGLNLSIPIYNNYRNKASEQKAKIMVEQANLGYMQAADQLRQNIAQAINDARNAKLKLEAAEVSVRSQEAVLQNNEKRYNAGAASLFELNTTRNNYQQALTNELIAKYDYLFAVKLLEFYLGKPLELKN